ncbi:hypothetical protein BS78_01G203600 [Paspalum vaginatum]|nr:hypothetical protein BS78_01G203600 [Paspalum vaginatum]
MALAALFCDLVFLSVIKKFFCNVVFFLKQSVLAAADCFQLACCWKVNMEQATSTEDGTSVPFFFNHEDPSRCLGTSASSSSGGELDESAAPPAGTLTQSDPPVKKAIQEFLVDVHNLEIKARIGKKAASDLKPDDLMDMIKTKMHRYPTSIRTSIQSLHERYYTTVPTVVAIGPYHHDRYYLPSKEAEKLKHVAAYHYTRESGHSVQEIYGAVLSVAAYARSLYDKDVVAGISDHDFMRIMFYDACFLVQYMLWHTSDHGLMVEPSLRSFFVTNDKALQHDVFLLENQLPWLVVETVMGFRPVPMEKIIAPWKSYLQGSHNHNKHGEQNPFALDPSYKPPHFLGLLRFYIVGRRSNTERDERPGRATKTGPLLSHSVRELEEIGIALKANKTRTELLHMGVSKKGLLFGELSLVPLYLNEERVSFLINMAALELCMTTDFEQAAEEDSAVCSYLLLLAMLVRKKDDVEKLRRKHCLLEKGLRAGVGNKDALDFFRSLQSLPEGSSYTRIMAEIASYKVNRRLQIQVLVFVNKNRKTILKVFSAIGVILGIIGSLVGILNKLKSPKG